MVGIGQQVTDVPTIVNVATMRAGGSAWRQSEGAFLWAGRRIKAIAVSPTASALLALEGRSKMRLGSSRPPPPPSALSVMVSIWIRRVSDKLSTRKSARRHDSSQPDRAHAADTCDDHIADDVETDPVEEWLGRHRFRRLGRMRID